jgi:hypothetical protein
MSNENAKFRLSNRTVEIKWVSQYCDHILDNYINKNKDHDLKFIQISKLLRTCKYFKQNKSKTWYAHNTCNEIKYRVVFKIVSNFTIIQTCYRYGYNED